MGDRNIKYAFQDVQANLNFVANEILNDEDEPITLRHLGRRDEHNIIMSLNKLIKTAETLKYVVMKEMEDI